MQDKENENDTNNYYSNNHYYTDFNMCLNNANSL